MKSYPDAIVVSKNMETNIPNLFIIGDSSSWTRGVGQASTSGMLAAEGVRRKLKDLGSPEKWTLPAVAQAKSAEPEIESLIAETPVTIQR